MKTLTMAQLKRFAAEHPDEEFNLGDPEL